ncbi:gp62 [Escherichia phage phiEB49]|uniref:Gp62 n=1 Tax=Escherichia phage phiEB49 TaxID=1048207 RepID=F8UBX2_9CAUD|nr:gp62 [Escherichia phage phiEB49]AEI91262.1 gp62 [Escherichia phage phiEB49]
MCIELNMKIVTIIVKDTITGSITEDIIKLKEGENGEHFCYMNGLYTCINLEHNEAFDRHEFNKMLEDSMSE